MNQQHRAAVLHVLKLLTAAQLINRPENGEVRRTLDLLADTLAPDYALADVEAAVRQHIKTVRFWPNPAELAQLCEAARDTRRAAAPARQGPPRPTDTAALLDQAAELHWPERFNSRADYESTHKLKDELLLEAARTVGAGREARMRFIGSHPKWKAHVQALGYNPFPEFEPGGQVLAFGGGG